MNNIVTQICSLSLAEQEQIFRAVRQQRRAGEFLRTTPEFTEEENPVIVNRLLSLRDEWLAGTELMSRATWLFYLEKLVVMSWSHALPAGVQEFLESRLPGFDRDMVRRFHGLLLQTSWR
jgi:hypothetical protein